MNIEEAKAIVNNEAMYCRSAGANCLAMTEGDSDYGAWLLRKAEAQEMVLKEADRLTAIVDELRKLCCDYCSEDIPRDANGKHAGDGAYPCDAWTDTEAAEAAKGVL